MMTPLDDGDRFRRRASPLLIDPPPDPLDPLPAADAVVITWTVDENDALADVLTPGFSRAKWHRYARFFQEQYKNQILKALQT